LIIFRSDNLDPSSLAKLTFNWLIHSKNQGAALGAMVGQMTYGKRQWEEFDDQVTIS
jgi:hypothetical protein